jgi:hypothetical protein
MVASQSLLPGSSLVPLFDQVSRANSLNLMSKHLSPHWLAGVTSTLIPMVDS